MFRLLVAGGRDFYDYKFLDTVLTNWLESYTGTKNEDSSTWDDKVTIVHGDAGGTDRLAAMWASYNDLEVEAHPANWKRHGVSAGPIRNAEMVASGVDFAILFPGGPGTKNMKEVLERNGINFKEVLYTVGV